MKRTKQILLLLAIILPLGLFAQLADGSYAKDFSLKKLSADGTVITDSIYTLYQHTDAGKPVIIDFSAVWCNPCWNYHSGHALKKMHENFGPDGTNELMVYFIEADQGTISQLNGVNAPTDTQGDWVTGTSYPILPTITPNTSQVVTDYAISSFPTVYLVCPDRTVKNLGQADSATLYNAAKACLVLHANAIDLKVFNVNQPISTVFCSAFTPIVTLQNYGMDTITSATIRMLIDSVEVMSYNWTGSIPRLDVAEITLPSYSDSTFSNGLHSIAFRVENPNNSVDMDSSNNVFEYNINNIKTVFETPIAEVFDGPTFPPVGWNKDDNSDGQGWMSSTTHGGCAKIAFYETNNKEVDYLYLPPVDLSSATSMNLIFKVAYAQYYSGSTDKLDVQVSTNCGATWALRYTKYGASLATSTSTNRTFTPTLETQWRQEFMNLSIFAGQPNLLIRFKSTSNFGNNCYIDDVHLDPAAAVEDDPFVSNMSLFPNPTNSTTALEFNAKQASTVDVLVFNAIGVIVYSKPEDAVQGLNSFLIPSDKFESGFYIVTIKGNSGSATQKLIIQK